jgi:hypothetical protein
VKSYYTLFKEEVSNLLNPSDQVSILREEDISHLPEILKKYLRFCGAIDKPRILNFRAAFGGQMKSSLKSKWMDIQSVQYNFIEETARLFYIRSKMFGIPFTGLHRYIGGNATMKISLASVIKVVDAKGEKMNQSETVTIFNDMCLLAPSTLIADSIKWKYIDANSLEGQFTHKDHTVNARLFFKENGELFDFISSDRYLSSDGKNYLNYPWRTPVLEYIEDSGRKYPSKGDAVWETPQGDFCYAHFDIKNIKYNCTEFYGL